MGDMPYYFGIAVFGIFFFSIWINFK